MFKSFFDSFDPNPIWNRQLPLKIEDIKKSGICSGEILVKKQMIKKYKPYYAVLGPQHILFFFKENSLKNFKASIDLTNIRADQQMATKDKTTLLIVTRHQKSIDLMFKDQSFFDQLYNHSSKYFILCHFSKYYSNEKRIGKGSFAQVHQIKRHSDNNHFAVKIFDKLQLVQIHPKAKLSVFTEIKVMRSIKHPNIVRLYEIYENERYLYLVIELLKGGELFERLAKKKNAFSEIQIREIMYHILSSLEYLQKAQILHRDIKPENLLLVNETDDITVKVADFGLSCFYKENGDYEFKRCGTPGFVAPEILQDQFYDFKADIFSAGVIFYMLLTGKAPFAEKSIKEILKKNRDCDINYNFKSINFKIAPEAEELLKMLLEKNPENRLSASQALHHKYFDNKKQPHILKSNFSLNLSEGIQEILDAQKNHKNSLLLVMQEEGLGFGGMLDSSGSLSPNSPFHSPRNLNSHSQYLGRFEQSPKSKQNSKPTSSTTTSFMQKFVMVKNAMLAEEKKNIKNQNLDRINFEEDKEDLNESFGMNVSDDEELETPEKKLLKYAPTHMTPSMRARTSSESSNGQIVDSTKSVGGSPLVEHSNLTKKKKTTFGDTPVSASRLRFNSFGGDNQYNMKH